jgi:hypothetical protein
MKCIYWLSTEKTYNDYRVTYAAIEYMQVLVGPTTFSSCLIKWKIFMSAATGFSEVNVI